MAKTNGQESILELSTNQNMSIDAEQAQDSEPEIVTISLLPDEDNVENTTSKHSRNENGRMGKDQPITQAILTFQDISYTVPDRGRICCPCLRRPKVPQKDKVVLDSVSGIFRPGLNAIMGPTGSGKSSLLDVLAARKAETYLTGTVLVNGSPRPRKFKYMTGYVIQDDTVMGMLTVRENIAFSAALRMPKGVSDQEREARVNEVISDLGLERCADTKVGTELRRGVSGGERKRTSIAMELLTSPRILFLDEPTTGLDAAMAQSVMWALKRLSAQNTTVVFSVHQPRFSIFRMFDTLHLLLEGSSVYHGPANQASTFFTGIGYVCVPGDNPADFVLDVLGGHLSTDGGMNMTTAAGDTNCQMIDDTTAVLHLDNETADEATRKQLIEAYQTSEWKTRVDSDLKPYSAGSQREEVSAHRQAAVSYPTSYVTQLNIVCRRTFFNMVRNPHTLITQVLSSVILALIIGTIYYQMEPSYSSGFQNRVGAFFFIAMNHVFGNMSAVDLFIKDRALFIHENVSGFYRVSVYFFAKLLCDVLPMRAFPIIVFSAISYWMMGLRPEFSAFVVFMVSVFLTSVAATSVALLMSATVETHAIGTILTALVWVFMMVFSGLLVNLKTVAPWLRWFKYISVFRYSMDALTVNELKGTEMCDIQIMDSGNSSRVCDYGDAYMERQGIPHDTAWDLYANHVALLALTVAFLTLTYIQLRRINKFR